MLGPVRWPIDCARLLQITILVLKNSTNTHKCLKELGCRSSPRSGHEGRSLSRALLPFCLANGVWVLWSSCSFLPKKIWLLCHPVWRLAFPFKPGYSDTPLRCTAACPLVLSAVPPYSPARPAPPAVSDERQEPTPGPSLRGPPRRLVTRRPLSRALLPYYLANGVWV